MRTRTALSLSVACPLLLGLTCPSEEPPLPPPLPTPVIDSLDIGASYFGTELKEAVRLVWHTPASDSVSVSSYQIFRLVDSGYVRIKYDYPANLTSYHDRVDDVGLPLTGYKRVIYRLVAIDSLGRSSDTSAADTVMLATPPLLTHVGKDTLTWSVDGHLSGYTSYALLWSDSGLVWTSGRPDLPIFERPDVRREFTVTLPDSLTPLSAGRYYWGAKIDVIGGYSDMAIGSIKVIGFKVDK